MADNIVPVKLFWTGGWDSTFRLVQLVLIYKKTVQPFYIIDQGRNSVLLEVRAMANIKKALFQKDSLARDLILPTIFKELSEVGPNGIIAESYKRLTDIEAIGIQYEWLARFCAEEGITGIEICNETAIVDAANRSRKLIGFDLEKCESDFGIYYKLNERAKGKDVYTLYGNFKFPVLGYTKINMLELSRKGGFEDIMKLTWFCLMPTKFSNPCGKCHPCTAVFSEGLKWRLPVAARIRYHTWPTLRKIAKFLRII